MDDIDKGRLYGILDKWSLDEILVYLSEVLADGDDIYCNKQANLLAAIAQILKELEDCRAKILEGKT
jgi:hypothetical protein